MSGPAPVQSRPGTVFGARFADNRLVSVTDLRKITGVWMSRIVAAAWLIAGTAVLMLAGCRGGPSSLPRSTTAYFQTPAASPAPLIPAPEPAIFSPLPATVLSEPWTVATPAPLPTVPIPAEAPSISLTAATAPRWPSNWVNAWIALESWSQFNGLNKPRQLTAGIEAAYALQTGRGALMVKMGSHAVRLGGVEFWLGFAPKLIRGLPYIHSLDARKTLQPLLSQVPPVPATTRTVVIDPGHGGKDSGTRSAINGEYEKFYALDCARRLQRLLEASNWRVILTRTNDTFLPLPDRAALAERVKADLFLSIHFNSGTGNGAQAGIETYCLTPNGMPSNLLREAGDDPRETHPNNAFDEQNFLLASRVHCSVLEATSAGDRGVRRARFMGVLRPQGRPAVLVEAGYLTTPADERKIATSSYRQSIAEGIARALE